MDFPTTYGLLYSRIRGFIRQKPEAGIQLVNRITWVTSDVSSLILQAWSPLFKWQHLFLEELMEMVPFTPFFCIFFFSVCFVFLIQLSKPLHGWHSVEDSLGTGWVRLHRVRLEMHLQHASFICHLIDGSYLLVLLSPSSIICCSARGRIMQMYVVDLFQAIRTWAFLVEMLVSFGWHSRGLGCRKKKSIFFLDIIS